MPLNVIEGVHFLEVPFIPNRFFSPKQKRFLQIMVIKIDPEYTFVVSPDFDPTVIPEGYIWDETAFKELVKATDKATADETIYTYGGPQGDTNVDYLNAADLTISDLKYNGDGQVVGTTVTANAFNNTGTVTTEGAIVFSVKSFTNSGEFNLDKNGVLTATSAITNAATGTINLNAGSTLQGSTIGNAGTITVVSDHATINGAITNHGIIDATKRKLIVVGDLQNANEDDTAEARDNTVITAREFEVTGNVVNYGILGTEMQPDHQIDISGELRNYRQIEVGILTAGSIYSDGYYPEIEEKCTRGYIIAGEVNAGSIDNVSGVIQTAAPKETGVGINVTGTINNGNADGIIAKLNAGINGWIQAATLNNLGNDIENENGLIIAGRLTVGDITNNGGISTRIVESTGTITNNATGLFALAFIDDPAVTGLVEGASITAGTIINGGTFTISSEEALPTPINVTSFENSGTLQLLGAGMTLSGDIVNETDGLVDVAGTVTGATATITNSGTISVSNADDVAGALTVGAITGSGLIRISVEGAVKAGDHIAVTADVSGNVIDLEVTLSGLTESSYQFVSGAIGEGVTFQVNGTVYEEGVVIGGTDYALSTMGGTGLWMVQQTTPTAKPAKSDIDGNDISEVMFVWTGTEEQPGNYQHGYWMNGTDTWQSANSSHPAEWENLGCYDMSGDGKADSVLVGNVTTETTGKGAYIGYYADAIDLVDGSTWVNIGYLTNSDDVAWKNKVGNLTGNASGANSIVWYAPELYALGAWTDGTDSWVSITNNFGGDDWTLVGCGDFDGDGKDSVVMTGANGAYFYTADLDGSVASMGASNWSGWEVRAIGDFSGDGRDDVVLFHLESGSMVMCADGDLDDFKSIGQLDAEDWFVVGCGDYNGDAQDDLLVRQYSSGMLGYYSGGDTSQWNTLGYGVGMEWTVIA